MKKLAVLTTLIFAVFFVALLPRPTFTINTLADTINNVVSATTWSGDPAVISVGTVFSKTSTSTFDSASVTDSFQWAWVREIASEDGYSSQTIDSNVKSMMSSLPMIGALPITQYDLWLAYDRYMIPLYDQFSGWSKSAALAQLQSDVQANDGKPLSAFGSGGGYYAAERYYDEWIQDLDIFLKMGDTATAASLWAGVNSAPPTGNWNGQDYGYRANLASVLECEVGFFAAVVANYKETVGGIPNFDRVSTDLYNKLLINGWSSPLWGAPSAMQHATDKSELRLQNTLGGIEALQMYYTVSDLAYKSAFVSLLTGATPAWQYFTSSPLWSSSDADAGAEKAALLFLYGIIPDSGSLAIPTNEWHYEDWTSMMPSTLFRFDYATHIIQIPVFAGTLKFCFGDSIASYNFPSNGVYQVSFSPDWNIVKGASLVEGLTRFHFLNTRALVISPF